MKDLNAICLECENDLAAIGIKLGWITGYTVNTRAKTWLGMCSPNGCGGYHIQISEVLLRDEVPLDELKNTVYHEQLHTCRGCLNHGDTWKRLAHKVSVAYGLDISRVASPDAVAVKIHATQRKENAKYKYECQSCGRIHTNMRETGFTRHPELYRCGKCGTLGNWKRIF